MRTVRHQYVRSVSLLDTSQHCDELAQDYKPRLSNPSPPRETPDGEPFQAPRLCETASETIGPGELGWVVQLVPTTEKTGELLLDRQTKSQGRSRAPSSGRTDDSDWDRSAKLQSRPPVVGWGFSARGFLLGREVCENSLRQSRVEFQRPLDHEWLRVQPPPARPLLR